MSTLIADSGSTSTEWCVVGEQLQRWRTPGLNPHFTTHQEFMDITQVLAQVSPAIDKVVFYGSGVGGPKMQAAVTRWLQARFTQAQFEVHNDLMGAARGALGTRPGVVAILGTGSNAASFDGHSLTHHRPSLGYVLGDAGGGGDLGRRLLRAHFSHRLSAETRTALAPHLPGVEDLLVTIYQKPQPNRYLAGYAKWMGEHRHFPDVQGIVKQALIEFVEDFVLPNATADKVVGAVGSVAYYFSDWFKEACAAHGFEVLPPQVSPLEGLMQYHNHAE